MTQSRRGSLLESLTNIAAGILLSFVVLHVMAPLLGFPMTWSQNAQVTAIMTALSLVRSYALRRLFNRWHR